VTKEFYRIKKKQNKKNMMNNTKKIKGGFWPKVVETAVVPFTLLAIRNKFKLNNKKNKSKKQHVRRKGSYHKKYQ
jgi:hypothetical protein